MCVRTRMCVVAELGVITGTAMMIMVVVRMQKRTIPLTGTLWRMTRMICGNNKKNNKCLHHAPCMMTHQCHPRATREEVRLSLTFHQENVLCQYEKVETNPIS